MTAGHACGSACSMELEPLASARAWRTMPLEGDAEDAEDSVGAVSHDWRCSANRWS
jgi:hypothetical protein